MKRILGSILTLGLVGALVIGATNAFFSDTETSKDNLFQAGKVDLKIDNESYYNGILNEDTSWPSEDLNDHLFFNFQDLKPGDVGEDTISLMSDNNDAWACMSMTMTANDDVTCTTPEKADDANCEEPGTGLGELGSNLHFIFWKDDGDNVFEDNEVAGIFKQGTAPEVFDGQNITLADANGGVLGLGGAPMLGTQTYYIAKAWCFGDMETNPVQAGDNNSPTENSGITCNGANLNNAAQTDDVKVDFAFSAVQSRNNGDFVCSRDEQACYEQVYTASVTDSSQGKLKNGNPITDPNRTDPTKANGSPDWVVGTGTNFYSLGDGGWVILKFSGLVDDGPGDDLSVHEATNGRDSYPVESAKVEVSDNGSTWYEVGTATSEPGGDGVTYFDVNGTGLSSFQYVRLTDTTNYTLHSSTADGFDLDAVDGVYGQCVFD